MAKIIITIEVVNDFGVIFAPGPAVTPMDITPTPYNTPTDLSLGVKIVPRDLSDEEMEESIEGAPERLKPDWRARRAEAHRPGDPAQGYPTEGHTPRKDSTAPIQPVIPPYPVEEVLGDSGIAPPHEAGADPEPTITPQGTTSSWPIPVAIPTLQADKAMSQDAATKIEQLKLAMRASVVNPSSDEPSLMNTTSLSSTKHPQPDLDVAEIVEINPERNIGHVMYKNRLYRVVGMDISAWCDGDMTKKAHYRSIKKWRELYNIIYLTFYRDNERYITEFYARKGEKWWTTR